MRPYFFARLLSKCGSHMPRVYNDCPAGQTRYTVTTEDAFGRAMDMCRQLDADDNEVKPGRRTRCFSPAKETARKQCTVLVDSEFRTVVTPSFYTPGELQRKNVPYECSNQDQIMMGDFEGQGDDFSIRHAVSHIVIGPTRVDGEWVVKCMDPESLVPHGQPPPQEGDVLSLNNTRRGMRIAGYVPTEEECIIVLRRWADERRWVCPADRTKLQTASCFLRSLQANNLCADHLFQPVNELVTALDTRAKEASFKSMVSHLFLLGMYQRRWTGEGTPYPFAESDTRRLVTQANVSQSLRGRLDPETRAPLDYVSSGDIDGAEGVLTNCMRMHGRMFMAYFEAEDWLDDDAIGILNDLQAASIGTRALVARHKKPTRYVHQLLPTDGGTLISLVESCILGQACIRMGSARMILSACMLYYSAFKTTGGVPWTDEHVKMLEVLDNII